MKAIAPGTVWLRASLTLVVAVVACSHLNAGDICGDALPIDLASESDPCPSGFACLSQYTDGYMAACTAATACTADSDCPGDFGCSAIDPWGDATYCATTCTIGCAVGYGCAADGVSCESHLGASCYVTDTTPGGCGNGMACSATTRVCTLIPQCHDDSDCGGFVCQNPNYCCNQYQCSPCPSTCVLSCTPATTDVDAMGCSPGFACNPQTFACSSTLGGPCDPASDDGAQCGVGGACSPASKTCVAATPCNTESECSGYGCQNGYCLLACTKNVLPCAVGLTCDLDTHTCG